VEADEFTMQSQEEGEDSTIENTTNTIVENVEEGITNHDEPIIVLRRSEKEKKVPNRLIISMIVIETTIDEKLLLEPTSFEEAMSTHNKIKWEEIINYEFHSLMQNETWTLTDLPLGRKVIGCKWILKIKLKFDGRINIYKARLVAKAYSQVHGVDYHDTFSLVVKITSIQMLMALVVANDFDVHQMDVKTTFLNGYLQETIYMEQPQGFIHLGTHHKVCKLHKTLYGLKQSPRTWYERTNSFILTSSFKKSLVDIKVYILTQDNQLAILALYVDDATLISNDADGLLKQFKSKLAKKFAMTYFGHIQYCLGI
jgi:hypothetical protein